MHSYISHFIYTLVFAGAFALPASAAAPQGALEVRAGGQKYSLPAVGEAADPEAEKLPLDAATLAVLESWRAFAWSADRKKYLYSFGAAVRTSAAVVLTPDGAAAEFAADLDRCAELLAEIVGAEGLRKDSVAIVCATQAEYERAVDQAAAIALARTEDPIQRAYLSETWRSSAKKNASFNLPLAGIIGCVEGNSEKWSPQHELIRGYAEAVVTGAAPYLANCLPLQAGLAWNVEFDHTGEILSMPNSEEFQFDIGRGSWSTSKIAAAFKQKEKEVRKEHGRALALADLPYLTRGATSTADSAAIGWAFARHLIRHHGAALPELLKALSDEVVEQNTVMEGDGSSRFTLQPGYALGWDQVEKVLSARLAGYRFADAAACMTSACAHCKAWAKERGVR